MIYDLNGWPEWILLVRLLTENDPLINFWGGFTFFNLDFEIGKRKLIVTRFDIYSQKSHKRPFSRLVQPQSTVRGIGLGRLMSRQ